MSSEDVFHLGIKALIRSQTGEVLLMQANPANLKGTQKGYWDLPGGRVQKGDSVEDTLKREVFEETAIREISDIQPVNMVLSNLRIPMSNDESVGLILSIYTVAVPNNAKIVLSDEHVMYEWCTPARAAELLRVKYPDDFCKAIEKLVS
jgi:8-oxo-dGTP pyrophosphatase MutT (NUDIX family)